MSPTQIRIGNLVAEKSKESTDPDTSINLGTYQAEVQRWVQSGYSEPAMMSAVLRAANKGRTCLALMGLARKMLEEDFAKPAMLPAKSSPIVAKPPDEIHLAILADLRIKEAARNR